MGQRRELFKDEDFFFFFFLHFDPVEGGPWGIARYEDSEGRESGGGQRSQSERQTTGSGVSTRDDYVVLVLLFYALSVARFTS